MRYAHARKDEAVFPLANGIIFAVDSARLFACDMANTASVWEQIQSRAGPSLLDKDRRAKYYTTVFVGSRDFLMNIQCLVQRRTFCGAVALCSVASFSFAAAPRAGVD